MKFINFIYILLILCFINSCTDNMAGTVDDTDTQIALTGYVRDKNGIGIEGIIAKMVGTNFLDTTDNTGKYNIIVHLDTLSKYNIELDSFSQIEFIDDNKMLDTIAVGNFTKEIQTINFYKIVVNGKFITEQSDFKLIQAIITGNPQGVNYSDTFNLHVDSVFNGYCGYSGPIYFNDNSIDTLYSIFVNVFNNQSKFVGRSPEVIFSNESNSILIPNFDPFNAVPIPTITNIEKVSPNDSLWLYGKAVDSFGGIITKWEWGISQDSVFIESESDTSVKIGAPSSIGTYSYFLRVTDNDSNVSVCSTTVSVISDLPTCSISVNNDTVSINDTVILTIHAKDIYGSISKIELNTGNSGEFEIYTDTFCTTTVSSVPGTQQIIAKVTDDDNLSTFDTINIEVLLDPPVIDTLIVTSMASVDFMIRTNVKIHDKYGNISSCSFKFPTANFIDIQMDSSDGEYLYYTQMVGGSLILTNDYYISIKIIDDDGNEVIDSATIIPNDTLIALLGGRKRINALNKIFMMGDTTTRNEAAPIHQVTLNKSFYMDSIETTQGAFDSIMNIYYQNNYQKPDWNSTYGVGPNLPVYNVGWYDAVLYCNAISRLWDRDSVYTYTSITGTPGQYCTLENLSTDLSLKGVRLPTEAEWEYAARGGTTGLNYWENLSDTITSKYCWYWTPPDGPLNTYEVAQKLPNEYGLYDMLGNVWEWVNDWRAPYSATNQTNPEGPSTGTRKVIRGWSFYDEAFNQNCVARRDYDPGSNSEAKGFNKGFRTVITY